MPTLKLIETGNNEVIDVIMNNNGLELILLSKIEDKRIEEVKIGLN